MVQKISVGISEISFLRDFPNPTLDILGIFSVPIPLVGIGGSGHLQIVGTDDAGTKTEIEVQSLPYTVPGDWPVFWTLDGEIRPADSGFSSDPVDASQFVEIDVNIGNKDAQAFYDQAIQVADAIQEPGWLSGAGVGYGANQNSNSFVTSVMWTLGIDVPAFGDALLPTSVEQLPGLNTNVIKDGVINTLVPDTPIDIILTGDTDFNDASGDTPNTDVFNGGLGDDRLFGGAGDDFLAGGGGADLIEGGEGDDVVDIGTGFHLIDQSETNAGSVVHQPGDDTTQGDGEPDIIVIGEGTGTDTILGKGDPNDRIVFRVNDKIGLELIGGGEIINRDDFGNVIDTDIQLGYFEFGPDLLQGLESSSPGSEVYIVAFYWLENGQMTISLHLTERAAGRDEELVATLVIENFQEDDFGITFEDEVIVDFTDSSDGECDESGFECNDGSIGEPIYGYPDGWESQFESIVELPAVPDPYEPNYDGTDDDSGVVETVTPGDDQVQLPNNQTDGNEIANFIDTLEGNDQVNGSSGDDIVLANDGDDIVEARNGHDWLDGGNGNDTLYGNLGDDILIGGFGDDYLNGGQGSDTVMYTTHDGVVVRMANGGEAQEIAPGEFDTLINIENLVASDGSDIIYGNGKDNLIIGLEGDDQLRGRNGNDALFGDAGADRLVGGNGTDYLSGGVDNDRLVGGAGADIFAFNLGDDRDVIVDFEAGIDRIELDLALADGFTAAGLLNEDNGYVSRLDSGHIRLNFGGGDRLIISDSDQSFTYDQIAAAIDFV